MTIFYDEIAVMLREINLTPPDIIFKGDLDPQQFNDTIATTLNHHNRVLCVSDAASNQAAKHVLRDVSNLYGELFHQIFDAPIEPNMENALRIIYAIAELNVTLVIAIGSGSINDLCKYAAHHAKLPYICIPTAASMNGYTAENASLIHKGLKQSFAAKMPQHLFIDNNVISSAPARMTLAGWADAYASLSACLDWQLSHLLLDSKFDARIARLCEPQKNQLETLINQGFAMTLAGSSAPASGGEHMLAHVIEMMHPELSKGMLHGELIAYTLLAHAEYQWEMLMNDDPPTLRDVLNEEELKQVFKDKYSLVLPIYQEKCAYIKKHQDKITERLRHYWPKWQKEFAQQLLNSDQINMLRDIARNTDILMACYYWLPYTHMTRNRFTFLDLERK